MTIALELRPANAKALARFLYARVPGAARLRFALKDLATSYVSKPEFRGVSQLAIGAGLIIDVGANRGQSIAAFRRLQGECDVIAFEPEPQSAAHVAARFSHDRKVVVHDCALGLKTGQLTFFIPRYGRWDCDGMAATNCDEATQWLRDRGRMFRFDESRLTVRKHVVQCRTLDSFRLCPVLIKLHAQGAELDILKGSQETLNRSAPALMCAFPTPELTSFVQQYGYRPHFYSEGRFAPGRARAGVTFTWFLTSDHLRRISRGLRRAGAPFYGTKPVE